MKINESKINAKIEQLLGKIKELTPKLTECSKFFREGIYADNIYHFDKLSGDDWRRNAFGNSLVRLRQFTEQNFNYIETMGLVSVTRYIFELSVWLHLLNKDKNYGLLYYKQLLTTQLHYYKDTRSRLNEEIKLLHFFEKKEKQLQKESIEKISNIPNITKEGISDIMNKSMASIDNEASKKFAIYLDDAKINGYGFQAHLVKKQAVPEINKIVSDIEKELEFFDHSLSKNQKKIFPKRWNWKQMAQKVHLEIEYNYIYTYASKLLHATPVSLTTDQKNLELTEVYLFTRYIYTKLCEILELSAKQPEFMINNTSEHSPVTH